MTKQEFERWVDYVAENGYKPVRWLVEGEGFEDWKTRLRLARWLSRRTYRQLKPAIELYKSVLDIEATEVEDIEELAWGLRDLAICIWHEEKNAQEALEYLDRAITLADQTEGEFLYIARGELWGDRWSLLAQTGAEFRALAEAEEKIKAFAGRQYKCNSYLYEAYSFKAELEYGRGNTKGALLLLKQALEYFPLEAEAQADLEQLWERRQASPVEAYETMRSLTHTHPVCWDI